MRGALIWIAWPLAVAEAVCVDPILAQVEELQNDGWSSGQGAAFQGGFATDEIGAVRLDPGAPIGLPFDVSLTGADDVLHEVTLGDDVVVNGPFRLGSSSFTTGRLRSRAIPTERSPPTATSSARTSVRSASGFEAARLVLRGIGSSAPRSFRSPGKPG